MVQDVLKAHEKEKNSESLLYSSVLEEPRSQSVGLDKILDEFETSINEPNVPLEQPTKPLDPESKMEKSNPHNSGKQTVTAFHFPQLLRGIHLLFLHLQGRSSVRIAPVTDTLCAKRNRKNHICFLTSCLSSAMRK